MRSTHTPISVTTGCSASTARGTLPRPSAMMTAALPTPASAQASVSLFTSPKPAKRHMLCGTRSSANAAR
jgi:hypothetical protein